MQSELLFYFFTAIVKLGRARTFFKNSAVFVWKKKVIYMKLFLRHKDLHAYGKICESVHKTASANKICKRKRNFAKV